MIILALESCDGDGDLEPIQFGTDSWPSKFNTVTVLTVKVKKPVAVDAGGHYFYLLSYRDSIISFSNLYCS